MVVSHRGNTGGFELEEGHRAASLLQVVEAIEGPIRLNLCLTSDRGCSRQGWCPAHPVWMEAQRAMVAVLNSANIDDMAKTAQQNRHEELALIDA
jgi:DNA-binding IscR family transcriptional regulator